ncbi:hypothetical protein ALT_3812 [Aspergillus lentulus]|uniref:Uncharacterized protein n=1 Tax=Aspergillus lentulus TaxID=293939 RepID=A0AAN4PIB0_ASPLE|nr:uncharacterized protein IFM58399_08911 [Aspergillus lentulus]KAF4152480.1 hypothetical protein CNMCM6069_002105 [Aspergillus lentulus]KAF4186501.1 hypothetical protein CNMCM7927_005466 [Aspergillus lentulus]GAQ06491.1 hypothetical protein ALT_3812 [Aspergillus lentulus]GFF50832.1 hypothetical protein IFM58399_08911 [Aspergillus lentulus]GFF75295.1 hypothetical protein IFM62136_09036 [Aspergillus lentulus]
MEEDQDIDINNTDNDMAKRAKRMDDALAQKLPVPWVYTDGTGDPANSTDWKLVEPWIEDTPKPPQYTKLSDLQVFNVISQDVSQSDKAVKALRRIGYLAVDSGKHNVLHSSETRAVTMLDFELMQACDESTINPERPEMYAILRYPTFRTTDFGILALLYINMDKGTADHVKHIPQRPFPKKGAANPGSGDG